MKLLFISLISIVFSIFPIFALSAEDSVGLEVGEKIPVSKLVSIKMESLDLTDDQSSVLVFYRGAWCPYCMKQLRAIEKDLLPKIGKRARLIAISTDSKKDATKMIKKYGFSFNVVSDPTAKILKGFNIVNKRFFSGAIIAHPSVFIIRKGKIIFADINTDYKERTAHNKILNAL